MAYIDESGFSHESTRSHGYAKIRKRCFSEFNWGVKVRINTIGTSKLVITDRFFVCFHG